MGESARPLSTRERLRRDVELPLLLDRGDARALPQQLASQWRTAMLDGRLPAGRRLPSSRVLASTLGVSRHVVLQAIEELMIEGYLTARQGSGVWVSSDVHTPAASPQSVVQVAHRWQRRAAPPLFRETPPQPGMIEFRLGEPGVERWMEDAWRRIWRDVGRSQPPGHYGHPQGELELREAVSQYLGRARGLRCSPEQVLITTSSRAALHLLIQGTVDVGDAVGMEEPGYRQARQMFLERGALVRPCPVDEDGLRIDALPAGAEAPVLLYCTPSHQYPLGSRLSLPRRLALLDWARRFDVLVVEDDYDSEFRFDSAPLPALASLDTASQVTYLGTFSKSLTPTIRLGYLVGSPSLVSRLVRYKQLIDGPVSWPLQRALTLALKGGQLERHIAVMRRVYARKRAVLNEMFRPHPDLCRLIGLEAGFHLFLEVPDQFSVPRILTRCAEKGVVVYSLDHYYHGHPGRQGLVLGYGTLALDDVRRGAAIILEALQAERLSAMQ